MDTRVKPAYDALRRRGLSGRTEFNAEFGPPCNPGRLLASRHLDRDGAQEIPLADVHTAMPQDGVGGGEMEIEVRQDEVVEIVAAFHLGLIGSEWKRDLAVGGGVDLFRIKRLEISDSLGEARLELIDGGLGVFVARRLRAGEAR